MQVQRIALCRQPQPDGQLWWLYGRPGLWWGLPRTRHARCDFPFSLGRGWNHTLFWKGPAPSLCHCEVAVTLRPVVCVIPPCRVFHTMDCKLDWMFGSLVNRTGWPWHGWARLWHGPAAPIHAPGQPAGRHASHARHRSHPAGPSPFIFLPLDLSHDVLSSSPVMHCVGGRRMRSSA